MGPFTYEKLHERDACLTQIHEQTEKKSSEKKLQHRAILIAENSVEFPYPQHSAYKNQVVNTQVYNYSDNCDDKMSAIRLVNSQKTLK